MLQDILPEAESRGDCLLDHPVEGAIREPAMAVAAANMTVACAAYAAAGQKWLCGPDATGALVVADPERLRIARPSYFSQSAYEPSGSFEPAVGVGQLPPRIDEGAEQPNSTSGRKAISAIDSGCACD